MRLPSFISRCLLAIAVSLAAGGPLQAKEDKSVNNIVLVHGAWVDGAGWEAVYRILSSKGYAVSVVQNPLTSFDDDVAAVGRVLARQNGPVLLVGHSYGGAVIAQAGNADNVAGLVFVAAFVPDAGESVSSLLEGGQSPPLQPSQDGFLFFDPAIFPVAFAHDVDPDRATFLAASQVPTSGKALATPVATAAWKTRPSFYLLTTEDRIIPPALQRQMAQRAQSEVSEVAAGHAVYLSRPEAVAELLEHAARQLSSISPGGH
jgi:pimeloyl-ACP methyl ester carboxylesterase